MLISKKFKYLFLYVVFLSTAICYAEDTNNIEQLRLEAESARQFSNKQLETAEKWKNKAIKARQYAKESQHKRDIEGWLEDARLYDENAKKAEINAHNAERTAIKAENELAQALKKTSTDQKEKPTTSLSETAATLSKNNADNSIKNKTPELEKSQTSTDKYHKTIEDWKEKAATARKKATESTHKRDKQGWLEDARLYDEKVKIAEDKLQQELNKQQEEAVTEIKSPLASENNATKSQSTNRKNSSKLDVERDQYQESDDINISYNIGKKERNELDIKLMGSENVSGSMHKRLRVDRKKNAVTTKNNSRFSTSYKDYHATLAGAEDFFRVLPKTIYPLEGAINILGSSILNLGEPFLYEVNIPKDRFEAGSSNDDRPVYNLGYSILPTPVIGSSYGQATLPWIGKPLKKAYTRIDSTTDVYRGINFKPGFYRVQLTTNSRLLDTQSFAIIVKPTNGAISFTDTNEYKVGERISIKVNQKKLNPRLKWYLRVIRILEDDSELTFMKQRDLDNSDAIKYFPEFKHAGNYVLQLITEGYPYYYITQQLAIKVTGKPKSKSSKKMYISVGHDPVFRQGEKITVSYNFTRKPAKGQEIVLYQKTEFDRNTRLAAREKDIEREGDKVIKSWKPEIGKPQAFLLDEALLSGSYSIRFYTDPKNKKHHYARADFKIIAKEEPTILGLGKDKYLWDETVPVNIKLPEGMSSDYPFLYLQLVRKGGYVPGCAIKDDQVILNQQLEGKTQHNLQFESPPGKYVLKLYDGDKIISRKEFTVTTTHLNGAIQISDSSVFKPGEKLKIKISVPDSIPQEALKDIKLGTNYLGYNTPGGTSIPANGGTSGKEIDWDGHQATVDFTTPRQGYHELLLLKRHNMCLYDDPCIVMDRVAYEVKHPNTPFKNNFGVWGNRPEYNLGGHYPFPPIGEYLDAKSCGDPFNLEPLEEKMKLRIVKWDQESKKYIPVKDALAYGEGFYIEGQFETDASKDVYIAEIPGPANSIQEVILTPDKNDPTFIRSKLLYLIWDSPIE